MTKNIFEELADARKEGRQPLCPNCHEPLVIEETVYRVRVWRWDAQIRRYRMGILDEGAERPGCLKCKTEFGRFWIGESREMRELGIDY
jgi:hypothetical protein